VILVKTPYEPDFVQKIKDIPGRRWNPEKRVWTIPQASEFRARKLVRKYFPAEDPEAWKEEAAETIGAQILTYLPAEVELTVSVIEEEDGTTTASIRRSDAPKLEEVNVTIEDDTRLREKISDEEAEVLAKGLQERKSCWLGFDS
jgi:hypothetical protein